MYPLGSSVKLVDILSYHSRKWKRSVLTQQFDKLPQQGLGAILDDEPEEAQIHNIEPPKKVNGNVCCSIPLSHCAVWWEPLRWPSLANVDVQANILRGWIKRRV